MKKYQADNLWLTFSFLLSLQVFVSISLFLKRLHVLHAMIDTAVNFLCKMTSRAGDWKCGNPAFNIDSRLYYL